MGETHSRCAPRIVEEVRSIRFNQEQEEELLHRHLSRSQDFETGSSVDIREVAQEQDLITALVNRERVCHPLSAQSVIALPFHPCPASRLLQIWPASCHLSWAVSLDATLSFSERSRLCFRALPPSNQGGVCLQSSHPEWVLHWS